MLKNDLLKLDPPRVASQGFRKGYIGWVVALTYFLVLPLSSMAQFGYVGAGFGVRKTVLNQGLAFLNENTALSAVCVDVGAMYRPYRFLGIGASVSLPVTQSSTFSFKSAKTSDGNKFHGFDNGYGTSEHVKRNMPKEFDYSFEQSPAITFKARLYVAPDIGVYFDLRYTLMTFSESFVFERPYRAAIYYNSSIVQNPAVPAENFNYSADYKLQMPGIGLGIQHHVSRHIYLNINANIDFMTINGEGFSHDITYDYDFFNKEIINVAFKDQAVGSHTSFVLQIGGGYIF